MYKFSLSLIIFAPSIICWKVREFFLSKFFYFNTLKQFMFIGVVCDFMIWCFAIPAFCFVNFHFLGLGLELETKQASQPLAFVCPTNLAWKDKEWTKVGSKWKCRVGNYTMAYCAKWLLTKHLKEAHGLVVEKSKPGRLSIAAGGPRHQDHAKMNACILGNAMAIQRRND